MEFREANSDVPWVKGHQNVSLLLYDDNNILTSSPCIINY